MYFKISLFAYIITGGIALKNKVRKIRQNKSLTASEIKSEPIDVIEILDD